jgi:hypothetical protein
MCRSPTRKLKKESRRAVPCNEPTDYLTWHISSPNLVTTTNQYESEPKRLNDLDRKQSHPQQLWRKGGGDVLFAITNAKPRWPAMTTANHETTDTSASDKSAEAEYGHI